MLNSKESTLKTQLTLSFDSGFDESALISGLDLTDLPLTPQPAKELQSLLSEIELINEDRQRLRQENEQLKKSLSSLPYKNLQIELLQKVATTALSENYQYKQKFSLQSSPIKNNIPRSIRIRSPSECLHPKPRREQLPSPLKKCLSSDTSSTTNSPLKSQRHTSARIRVSRNQQKYPKQTNKDY